MVRISDNKRSRIYALYKEGFSSRYIAKKENVSQPSVVRICNKVEATGSVKDLPKCGAPRIFTNRDERSIIRLLASGKCSNAVEIQKYLRIYENIVVSEDTVKRALRRNGLSSRVKRKKPFLNKRTRKERYKFAKKYKDWSVEDWRRVIWSDESKFKIYGSDGRQYCWKRPNEPFNERNVIHTKKYGGGSVMVWGCFSSFGVGNIVRIYGTMDGDLYRQILSEDLLGTIRWYGLRKDDIIFQQDNDSKHTATDTKVWFYHNGIEVLDWPPYSPDLNPIEHLWNEIDKRRRRLHVEIDDPDELWEAIQKVWVEMDMDYLNKLIESMPQRVMDVYKAKGGYTEW